MKRTLLLLPLLTSTLLAIDPPGIEWMEDYASYFYDVHETSDGNFIVAGRNGEGSDQSLLLFSPGGDLEWEYGIPGYEYYQHAEWVEEVSDGYVFTGDCRWSASSSYCLFVGKVDLQGQEVWTRIFDYSSLKETGYCVTPIPSGGYAICGRVNGSGSYLGQAWVLRTDADGDTLWTNIWGQYTVNDARRVICQNDLLHVLTYGRISPDSARGVHLITWDLEGNLVDEVRIRGLLGQGMDMCYCPWDGGFTIVTQDPGSIAHVDGLGNLLWRVYTGSDGYSVSTTLDGDYIYGGQKYTFEPDFFPAGSHAGTDSEWRGHVALFSPVGEKLWEDWIYELDCSAIYSIRQLSQGGYIAAGQSLYGGGLLIRYAPETGIEIPESPLPTECLLTPIPNPSTGGFSISFDLPMDGQVVLSVYDLSGRWVAELFHGAASGGDNRVGWDTGDLPSGCYVVVLRRDVGVDSKTCVLLR